MTKRVPRVAMLIVSLGPIVLAGCGAQESSESSVERELDRLMAMPFEEFKEWALPMDAEANPQDLSLVGMADSANSVERIKGRYEEALPMLAEHEDALIDVLITDVFESAYRVAFADESKPHLSVDAMVERLVAFSNLWKTCEAKWEERGLDASDMVPYVATSPNPPDVFLRRAEVAFNAINKLPEQKRHLCWTFHVLRLLAHVNAAGQSAGGGSTATRAIEE